MGQRPGSDLRGRGVPPVDGDGISLCYRVECVLSLSPRSPRPDLRRPSFGESLSLISGEEATRNFLPHRLFSRIVPLTPTGQAEVAPGDVMSRPNTVVEALW